jgi:hypothetical protein
VGRGVRALAQLKMLTRMSKCQEGGPGAGQHIYIDVPLRIEPYASVALAIDAAHRVRRSDERHVSC